VLFRHFRRKVETKTPEKQFSAPLPPTIIFILLNLFRSVSKTSKVFNVNGSNHLIVLGQLCFLISVFHIFISLTLLSQVYYYLYKMRKLLEEVADIGDICLMKKSDS